MRILLALWFVPLALFWGWYALSVHDLSFGFVMLSREVHDLVFRLYGEILGIAPAKIPGLAAWACLVDSAVVLSIAAFRWRAKWLPQTIAAAKFAGERYWNAPLEAGEEDISPEAWRSAPARPAE